MYKQIMVPTDGSGFDREAILVALRVAERCKAKIRLVRVMTEGARFGLGALEHGAAASLEASRAESDAALGELYALAAECRGICDVDITVDLEHGAPGDVLPGYARRNEIDLIVISSHGRRGLARLSLGSVTDSLIRGTAIAVLVVKPKASYLKPEACKEFHRIVVPLDGSPLAEQVLAKVIPLAQLEDAEVTLVRVIRPSQHCTEEMETGAPWWEKAVAHAKAYLTQRAIEIRVHGVPARIDVVVGENVAHTISDFARRERADLIAIATHGRGTLGRILRGSVADGVTKSAVSSILVFHAEEARERDPQYDTTETAGELIPALA
jgi:nucleotide-binding universal stress UspA family protein